MTDPNVEIGYFEARNVRPADPGQVELPPWLDDVLPRNLDASILDVGCGTGGHLFALARRGYRNVRGIDSDSAAIQYCRQNGLEVLQGDIVAANLSSLGSYDLILMNHVLEHLPKDQMIDVLKNLRSCLHPGGGLCIAVPNAQSSTGAYWAFEDFTHTFLFTSGSLYFVARKAGFSDIRFLDIDCLAGSSGPTRWIRKALLSVYKFEKQFWNKVTRSSFHNESPAIFSYEIKALLRRGDMG